MTLKFNKTYFTITLVLFITEVFIAIYLKSGFIRHTFGDFLVVILLYSFFKSFIKIHSFKLAIAVLLLSFFVDLFYSLNGKHWLKIENSFEISGLHHNAFGGFMGVRIGLCSIGEGEVNYKNFKYSSIPEY